MSSTTTAASATPSVACSSNLYDIPVTDAACAVAFGGNHTDVMSGCCKSADVVSYYDDCGLYCLAADQSVKALQDCLFAGGMAWQSVFCNAGVNATATATDASVPATAQASVVSSGDSSSSDGGDDGKGGSDSSPTSSEGAGPRLQPDFSVSKLGLTIGALLFSATALGAFQL
ncbi:Uu.00g104390.m01.CDS01 [Anthostomella pinea]|uniref:Uu.00g104390.m01.CDS01 n=1 Tax=Anthostomella pinea TaxID=933095 RepID=A0AAI8YFU1_9PEZI|nr:Uu.00g104390.m01.CDS01 [Anthostomella pinea]